ncbi:MAG TPA: winged helix DNA-binding domain-containing protein, partial [Actinotalea sp.]|nr:winged helix DNA-binding domain-containing protein [Actinotalea sp.]
MATGPREIALLRLVAQRVVGAPAASPAGAVGHLLALQAQDLPGALTSIALRTAGRSRDEVRAAFDRGDVVRSWPMRGTLHAVPARDLGWMLDLMTARPLAAAARRRQQLGLDDADLRTARDLVVAALRAEDLSREQLLDRLRAGGLPTTEGRGYHLLVHLAMTGVVCLGPFGGTEQLFVLLDRWVPEPRSLDREQALAELNLRYLRGHGPATVADLARWSGLPLGEVRRGLAAVTDRLDTLVVDGTTYHLDPGTPDLLAEHRAAA